MYKSHLKEYGTVEVTEISKETIVDKLELELEDSNKVMDFNGAIPLPKSKLKTSHILNIMRVGKDGVTNIRYHEPSEPGTQHYADVEREGGVVVRIFNPSIVVFRKVTGGNNEK